MSTLVTAMPSTAHQRSEGTRPLHVCGPLATWLLSFFDQAERVAPISAKPHASRAAPDKALRNRPAPRTFSAETNTVSASIQRMLMAPPTQARSMSAQQQPRQNSPMHDADAHRAAIAAAIVLKQKTQRRSTPGETQILDRGELINPRNDQKPTYKESALQLAIVNEVYPAQRPLSHADCRAENAPYDTIHQDEQRH